MNFLRAADFEWSEQVTAADQRSDEHRLEKLSKIYRLWQRCEICDKLNIWPWTTVLYKCDTCRVVCHKKCVGQVSQVSLVVTPTVDNVVGSTCKLSNTEMQYISPTKDYKCDNSEWSERVTAADQRYDEHRLEKLSNIYRVWKKCEICYKRNIWPWTTVYKCDRCRVVCHKKCAGKVSRVCSVVTSTVDNVAGSTFKLSNTETQYIDSADGYRCPDSTIAEQIVSSADSVSSGHVLSADCTMVEADTSVSHIEFIHSRTTLNGTRDFGFDDQTATTSRKDSVNIVLPGQKDSGVVSPGRQDAGANDPSGQQGSGGVVSLGQQDSATAVQSGPADSETLVWVSPENSGANNSPSQQDPSVVHSSGSSDSGAVGTTIRNAETPAEVPGILLKYKNYDEHRLEKLSKIYRVWKKCEICYKRNIRPWSTVYKCDGCRVVCHKKCAGKVSRVCSVMTSTVDNDAGSTFNLSNTETQYIGSADGYRCPDSTIADQIVSSADSVSSGHVASADGFSVEADTSVSHIEFIHSMTTLNGTRDFGFDDQTATTSRKDSATIVLPGQKDSGVVSPGRQDAGANDPSGQQGSGGVVSLGQQDSATEVQSGPADSETLVLVSPENSGANNSPSQQDPSVVHSSGPSDSGAVGTTKRNAGSLSETPSKVPGILLKYKKYAEFPRPCPSCTFDRDEFYEDVFNRIRRRRSVSLSIVMQNGHFVRRYTNVRLSRHAEVKVSPLPTVSSPLENPISEADKVENSESPVRSHEEPDKPNEDGSPKTVLTMQ